MGNTNSNNEDSVNLKMSKEQYKKYQNYMRQQQIAKKQQNDRRQQIAKKQQVAKKQQNDRRHISNQSRNSNQQSERDRYILQNQYETYNQNKKNVDNKVNNYQMFNNRRHSRNFNITPIGMNTSNTDISGNFSPNVYNNSNLAFNKPPIPKHKQTTNRSNFPSNKPQYIRSNKQPYNTKVNYNPKIENRKKNFNINEIMLKKCDPFNILKQNKKISLENLRDKYKKLALIHHPDKGGNINKFKLLIDAYKNINELIERNKNDKDFNELKNNFQSDIDNEKSVTNKNFENENFNLEKFNQVYQDNKLEDYNNYGYGDIMEKTNSNRDDIEVTKTLNKYSKKNFNLHFNKEKEKIQSSQVIKYTPPKPLEKNGLKYSVLGEAKKDSYTSENNNLKCADYKEAHIDNLMIDPKKINYKTYKSVKELKKARTGKLTLTDNEIRRLEYLKQEEEKKEWERINRVKLQDKKIAEQYQKVNHLMLR